MVSWSDYKEKDNSFSSNNTREYIEKKSTQLQEFIQKKKEVLDLQNKDYQGNRFELLEIKQNIEIVMQQKEEIQVTIE